MQMMFFHFLKIIFNISTSKRSETYKLYQILTKKNSNFLKIQLESRPQTLSKSVTWNATLLSETVGSMIFDYQHTI